MQQRLGICSLAAYLPFVERSIAAVSAATGLSHRDLLDRYSRERLTRERMSEYLLKAKSCEELARAMRLLRRDTLISLAIQDTTGHIGYETVVRTMTDLAEECVSRAVAMASREMAERFGEPVGQDGTKQDLLVVAMGKLGGSELNVSSDIDLVFVYDEDGRTQSEAGRSTVSNHEFFERLARRVIALINCPDEIGFVFRVDCRLRPFGDDGPIVVSSEMLEEYLSTQGRDWERFAWLKARVVSTPVFSEPAAFCRTVDALYRMIRPFVYRRYVDFGALNALSRVHAMIRSETVRRELGREAGINVKLGRGGIREIEFIVQTFQVMRGGRERKLQGRQTLPMLEIVSEVGCLDAHTVRQLAEDYIFLRNLEHALQYVDDKQTHFLADVPETYERIGAMLGLTALELRNRLESVRAFVSGVFDSIFQTQETPLERRGWPVGWRFGDKASCEKLAEKLRELGFKEAEAFSRRIVRDLSGQVLTTSDKARDCFTLFVMTLAENAHSWAESFGLTQDAETLFERYLGLLEVIAGRPTYVMLLNQFPAVAKRVARILTSSRWAANFLYEHPLLLDELVGAHEEISPDTDLSIWDAWQKDVSERLTEFSGDTEALLNVLRDATHSAVFRLLVSDLQGLLTVERTADHLSALADAVLRLVMEQAWKATPARHREAPKVAAVGYGKLGGKELGYASDLDLVFLFEDDAPEAASVYARFVRRVISWLTVQTSSGKLYSVDTRLRPEGHDGLLVCSFEHFKHYQESTEGAWVWEHQALTRARFCAGDIELGKAFEAERTRILCRPRETRTVQSAVVAMRRKILESCKNTSGLFDLKRDRGGMLDVEFAVQTLVLTKAHRYPQLTRNLGNSSLLAMSAELGLIPNAIAEGSIRAYRTYRDIQRMTRLNLGENTPVRVAPEKLRAEKEAVTALWRTVLETDEPCA